MRDVSRLESVLRCVTCGGVLAYRAEAFSCATCARMFVVKDGKVFFEEHKENAAVRNADDLIYCFKRFLKKNFPRLTFFIYRLTNVRTGRGSSSLVKELPNNALILNIGSGTKPVHPRTVNIDFVAEPGVDVVANAYALPFRDASADLVICESLLEHLEHPEEAVAEMRRVLKKGGRVYIVTPFMFGFHSSPDDFYRWTIPGMTLLLGGFSVKEAGVEVGPTGAMTAMLREWLAMLLSFNSPILYQLWVIFFMGLFIPLHLFDYLLSRYSFASQTAMEYYCIAAKE